MNPQVSLWNAIAENQKKADFERQLQERKLKKSIRAQYQKQLDQHISKATENKMREQQKEQEWERSLVRANILNQQKRIQMEKAMAQASNQRQHLIDIENHYSRIAQKEKQQMIREYLRRQEIQLHRRNQQRQKKQMQQNERRKKQMMDFLKKDMEQKQMRSKLKKQEEYKLDQMKFQENQRILERQRQQREEYLRKMKSRSMTIDYGSHESFQKNHEKSLTQKVKQEIQGRQQYQRRAKQVQQYETQLRRSKKSMELDYKSQLERQIIQKEQSKRYNHKKQLEEDNEAFMRYQNYSKSVDMQRKAQQDRHKKELIQFLKKQIQEKNKTPKENIYMREKQIQLNSDLLKNSQVIPVSSFGLDPARKKQLEMISRSFQLSPTNSEKNYLAERGKTILY